MITLSSSGSPIIDVGLGVYRFLPNTEHVGPGVFRSGGRRISVKGCAFELADRVRLEGLTLDGRSALEVGDQNQVVGFCADPPVHDVSATVLDCIISGRSFGVYVWSGSRIEVNVKRSMVEVGRWAVCAGGSGGADNQTINLEDSNLIADFDAHRGAGGDIGASCAGIVARGGVVAQTGGTIRCKGSSLVDTLGRPYIDRVVGAYCTPQPKPGPWGEGKWPLVVLNDVDCKVLANGSSEALDAIADIGKILIIGGRGSGPSGEWIVRGNVECTGGAREIRR
ncbi:MAG: hypothetical protein AB7I37_26230 [Pirellulales bacterium]